MPSVLIVDDHLLIRHGLKQMLSQEHRGLVFGEAKSSEQAVHWLARQFWDIVILDIAIPSKDGFHVLEEARRRHPNTRVLVLSMHADPRYVLRAQQMGASGYVCKNAGRSDLLKAFRNVLAGKEHFECIPALERAAAAVPVRAGLSKREYSVMMAFVAGKRASDIAAELHLSVKTVSTYKRRILDKLGLQSTADLVRYVIDYRLS